MNIKTIIDNELCTGCGACVSEDLSGDTYMIWNDNGFLVPNSDNLKYQNEMYRVCPFNLKGIINEDYLASEFLIDTTRDDPEIGRFNSLYVGYSNLYRATSSSGGIATYVFEYLLKNKIVDYLFVVKENEGKYCYQLFDSFEQIKEISKTRYYPVTMESLYNIIDSLNGKVAVSGVACFIKSIRLKQHYHPYLKSKIVFLVGIICGGLKSREYTDFLAQSSGCHSEYKHAEYRIKNARSYALDYKFSCINSMSHQTHTVDMLKLGDMWGTGLFKSNACDFCDDVTTELADISLGDAWIHPYNKDGLGNSVIVTRSGLADFIIKEGLTKEELSLSNLSLSDFKKSQSGSFNHRHKGLLFRINRMDNKGFKTPLKRERFLKKQTFIANIIQILRLQTRMKSFVFWSKYRDVELFNKKMKPYLLVLRKVNALNHKLTKLRTKLSVK